MNSWGAFTNTLCTSLNILGSKCLYLQICKSWWFLFDFNKLLFAFIINEINGTTCSNNMLYKYKSVCVCSQDSSLLQLHIKRVYYNLRIPINISVSNQSSLYIHLNLLFYSIAGTKHVIQTWNEIPNLRWFS